MTSDIKEKDDSVKDDGEKDTTKKLLEKMRVLKKIEALNSEILALQKKINNAKRTSDKITYKMEQAKLRLDKEGAVRKLNLL
jgi:hypothetical protein